MGNLPIAASEIELVLIPAGCFLMGSNDGQRGEKPVRRVKLTKPFYLGKYPVTQKQWELVMGINPSRFNGAQNPVEQVSWADCQEFIEALNAQTPGGGFRLPTEAEWEYACRAGSTSAYYFGDNDEGLGEYAWYGFNSGDQTHPVGQKKPNAWGLYDMHGNVWEWCQSLYNDYPYRGDDGREDLGSSGLRVLRGGSWYDLPQYCRSATRSRIEPTNASGCHGFRVVVVSQE